MDSGCVESKFSDGSGSPCLELIAPNQHKYDGQEHFDSTSNFMISLNRLAECEINDVPVISPDDNFELKGNLTDSTYLRVYQYKDTGEKYSMNGAMHRSGRR